MKSSSKTKILVTKPILLEKWLDKILSNQEKTLCRNLEIRTKTLKPLTRSFAKFALFVALQLPESKPKLAYETFHSLSSTGKPVPGSIHLQSYENTFYSLSSTIKPLHRKTVLPHSMKNTFYLASSTEKSFAETFSLKTVCITYYNDFNNTATIPTLRERKGGLLCL